MSNNIVIGNYAGFNIFEPAPEIIPESLKIVTEKNAVNQNFLSEMSPDEKMKPGKSITGSFIYAHAPDYVGNYTLNWGVPEWKKAFEKLRKKQVDTVILQASVWNELNEVYYSSKTFSSFNGWNVVEPMLHAAKEAGMTVFLGGYGSISGWNMNLNDKDVLLEIERQTTCLSELLRYRELFDGVYYSPETAFRGVRDLQREQRLHWIYQTYFSKIKEMAPEKKILMSPASKWIPGKEEDFIASWLALFDDVPLDILAPQDSIGCSGCTLDVMPQMWKLWRTVTDRAGITLWANIELFERMEFGGPEPFKTASADRIRQQCRAVAPFVEKCICWEALYFDLP
ncbi:MAG: DUF4434 domain-containing protein [Lentisphaeria bacterium]|nr:DUF4434 domain-containing protein [Lentisphaeria bacterium]